MFVFKYPLLKRKLHSMKRMIQEEDPDVDLNKLEEIAKEKLMTLLPHRGNISGED